MKAGDKEPAAAADEKKTFTLLSRDAISRREFLAGSAAAIAAIYLTGPLFAAADGKKTFTILHTNDMHTSFIGMGPAADYTPFALNDDATLGGYARLAAMIAKRKAARQGQGPVLVLDAGDYSMGTAFAAATREIGGELKLMGMMGYDATTFGNHEFDLGPDGLGRSISVAAKAGRIPAVLPSNTDFTKKDKTLADLQRLARDGVVRRYVVIERGGIRFGIFGLLGKEAMHYTSGGATVFADPIETAKEMVALLREKEKVDLVIALSHGGVEKGKDGRYTEGEDVHLPRDVPGIDVVISGHSHTFLNEATIVNDRTPVVQTGKESKCLGELVITIDGNKLTVESYQLYPIDDSIAGDRAIADEIDKAQEGGHRGRLCLPRLQYRSAAGNSAAGSAQYLLRYRCQYAPRQPLYRRLQKGHQSGHRLHRQRDDARRPYQGEVRCTNRLRRIRHGAARRRYCGYDGRQRPCDRVLKRSGSEESA